MYGCRLKCEMTRKIDSIEFVLGVKVIIDKTLFRTEWICFIRIKLGKFKYIQSKPALRTSNTLLRTLTGESLLTPHRAK